MIHRRHNYNRNNRGYQCRIFNLILEPDNNRQGNGTSVVKRIASCLKRWSGLGRLNAMFWPIVQEDVELRRLEVEGSTLENGDGTHLNTSTGEVETEEDAIPMQLQDTDAGQLVNDVKLGKLEVEGLTKSGGEENEIHPGTNTREIVAQEGAATGLQLQGTNVGDNDISGDRV